MSTMYLLRRVLYEISSQVWPSLLLYVHDNYNFNAFHLLFPFRAYERRQRERQVTFNFLEYFDHTITCTVSNRRFLVALIFILALIIISNLG